MIPAQIQAWVTAVQLLLAAGVATVNQIKALVRSLNPGATDEELNAIIEGVRASARSRAETIAAERAALRVQFPDIDFDA